MTLHRPRILHFDRPRAGSGSPRVGRVHKDGSVTFQGKTYATLKEVPPDWLALRPDRDTYRQWRRIYRAIDPRSRRHD